jgi:hypothetical protein
MSIREVKLNANARAPEKNGVGSTDQEYEALTKSLLRRIREVEIRDDARSRSGLKEVIREAILKGLNSENNKA